MKTKKPGKYSAESAALALLKNGCYPMGRDDDHFMFAGRMENACERLVDGGLAQRHPKGLMIYSQVYKTLTSDGRATGKQMYRLTAAGKTYAEKLRDSLKEAEHAENKPS